MLEPWVPAPPASALDRLQSSLSLAMQVGDRAFTRAADETIRQQNVVREQSNLDRNYGLQVRALRMQEDEWRRRLEQDDEFRKMAFGLLDSAKIPYEKDKLNFETQEGVKYGVDLLFQYRNQELERAAQERRARMAGHDPIGDALNRQIKIQRFIRDATSTLGPGASALFQLPAVYSPATGAPDLQGTVAAWQKFLNAQPPLAGQKGGVGDMTAAAKGALAALFPGVNTEMTFRASPFALTHPIPAMPDNVAKMAGDLGVRARADWIRRTREDIFNDARNAMMEQTAKNPLAGYATSEYFQQMVDYHNNRLNYFDQIYGSQTAPAMSEPAAAGSPQSAMAGAKQAFGSWYRTYGTSSPAVVGDELKRVAKMYGVSVLDLRREFAAVEDSYKPNEE